MHAVMIGIVSLSSILPREQFDMGTNALATAGFSVKVAPNVFGPAVAPAAERARLLQQFWLDPEIDMLLFSRGGEGAADVLPLLDWEALRSRPDLPVIGFSDLTLLLNAMLAKGVGHPLSGPMLSYAGRLEPEARDWYLAALAGAPLPPIRTSPMPQPVGPPPASVCGLPMGGHLERLRRLLGMGLLPSAEGRVVFLECTAKYPPTQVRRCLEDLRDGGAFAGAAAVVFCDFRHKGEDRAAIDAFLPEFAATLPCPAFSGFPYGHTLASRLLDFRREVTVAPDGTVGWGAAAAAPLPRPDAR